MQKRKARRNTYAPAAIVFMKIKKHFPGGEAPKWSKVCGPLSTTVANLRRIGWDPKEPDEWTDRGGNTWKCGRYMHARSKCKI